MVALIETLNPNQAQLLSEGIETQAGKRWYLQGIIMEGDTLNHNQRIYPTTEIRTAVNDLQSRIQAGFNVLGELDHPESMQINLDRVSHTIEKVWMDGNRGMGRLKILTHLPCGKIVEGLLIEGIRLGVSTRGTGDVNESTARVSDFECLTADIVAMPSAPNAYPQALNESRILQRKLFESGKGTELLEVSTQLTLANDKVAERHFKKAMLSFIKTLS